MSNTIVRYAQESGHFGVWMTFHVGMHTGFRDNDFYGRNFQVHASKDDAENYRSSFGAGRQPELRFIPFGMRIRNGWEVSDLSNLRYVAPGYLAQPKSGEGEVFRVAIPGRQIGQTVEWLSAMLFPSSEAAHTYVSLTRDPHELQVHRMAVKSAS